MSSASRHRRELPVPLETNGNASATQSPCTTRSGYRKPLTRKMLQNLAWAAGHNIVAIPLAAGVLAWAGTRLSPAGEAIVLSASTIVVALNAQLLRRVRLTADER
jgi:P-type Cu2+ transporter